MSANPSLTELARWMAGTESMDSKCTREIHEALKMSATWVTMDFVGIQETDQDYSLELRNCKCGSTLAKRVPCSDLAEK